MSLAPLGHPNHWPRNQGPGQRDTSESLQSVDYRWKIFRAICTSVSLTHSALLLLDETHCLASKSPKYNYSPITTRLGGRCRKLRTRRIKCQNKAQQNAGTKPVFLYMFVMVLPQGQIVSLIQATVPASCADRVSITSCHLGKQLLHRKAKGIKGISPVFTVPRYKTAFSK